jgi:hypothetical protein
MQRLKTICWRTIEYAVLFTVAAFILSVVFLVNIGAIVIT